ncbi:MULTISPECIES: cytochrome d ubiquinol oxidase subunit II [Actinomadura]|uniref:Cytochrome d ubiquinol oxidase subunit II n=1 Tax=Actinomadura litoris TaxID=2678616 RepID=A0A7K1KZL5_9ACTN|nr:MULTISPECIES: cytochrome d ubiquinol oxidase subunit II [Actinomadura]MBT2211937.1 cytochrome d ubiquinol oxidase subunit II [Actinomadura sp. NEAU-AAG7]MUN37569.1 cytochrome d ubiquinol oxidase subunit II [Actinomadura litoris]
MEFLAVVMLAVFTAGYLVLAGGDVGVGMALPWLGRGQDERRLVIASFAPFFLGNEVWLVAAVGIVVGAFPGLEHRLLEDLSPVAVVLVVGWVVRDMGLWLRGRVDGAGWRGGCDGAVVAGSWALALGWASLLGSLVVSGAGGGEGMNAGSVLGLPLAALFVWHGVGFARWRLPEAMAARLRGVPARYGVSAVVLAAAPVAAGAGLPWSGAAAQGSGLALTAVAAVVLLPLLAVVQGLVWWTFRGRVQAPSYL